MDKQKILDRIAEEIRVLDERMQANVIKDDLTRGLHIGLTVATDSLRDLRYDIRSGIV